MGRPKKSAKTEKPTAENAVGSSVLTPEQIAFLSENPKPSDFVGTDSEWCDMEMPIPKKEEPAPAPAPTPPPAKAEPAPAVEIKPADLVKPLVDGMPKLESGEVRAVKRGRPAMTPEEKAQKAAVAATAPAKKAGRPKKDAAPARVPYDPKNPDSFDETARAYLQTALCGASAIVSEEWMPENDGEFEMLRVPLAAHMRAQGTTELSPKMALAIAALCYAVKRCFMPKTKAKLAEWFGKKKDDPRDPNAVAPRLSSSPDAEAKRAQDAADAAAREDARMAPVPTKSADAPPAALPFQRI